MNGRHVAADRRSLLLLRFANRLGSVF
jgi:hypothetical protein